MELTEARSGRSDKKNKLLILSFGISLFIVTVLLLIYARVYITPETSGDKNIAIIKTGVNEIHSGRYQTAIDILQPLAVAGDSRAQFWIGKLYSKGWGTKKDYKIAFEWLLKAAEQGHADAQYAIAGMYAYGQGVEKDYGKASLWSNKAVDNGYGAKVAATNQDGNKSGKDK